MFRVGSEYVQSMFKIVKIVVIALSSASSVSVFGIFLYAFATCTRRSIRLSSHMRPTLLAKI